MKILAFTDMHGRISMMDILKQKAKKCDLIICCGDLTTFENELVSLVDVLASFAKPVLIVHGNHEDEVEMERACKRYKNVHFIHKMAYERGKTIFLGYGGGGFARRELEFDRIAREFKKQMNRDKKAVLVLHGPPHGTLLDIIGDDHVGCVSYTEFIDKSSVQLVLCGHLHENFKVVQNYRKKTIILNPGPDGMIIEV